MVFRSYCDINLHILFYTVLTVAIPSSLSGLPVVVSPIVLATYFIISILCSSGPRNFLLHLIHISFAILDSTL